VLSLTAVIACGSLRACQGCAAPAPSVTTPASGFDVLVTERDRAVTVHVGQKIEVYLVQKAGMTSWGTINADNPSVLRAVETGLLVPRSVTVAGFQALTVGSANITASAGPLCSPGAACPMYAMLYSVAVIVTQ